MNNSEIRPFFISHSFPFSGNADISAKEKGVQRKELAQKRTQIEKSSHGFLAQPSDRYWW